MKFKKSLILISLFLVLFISLGSITAAENTDTINDNDVSVVENVIDEDNINSISIESSNINYLSAENKGLDINIVGGGARGVAHTSINYNYDGKSVKGYVYYNHGRVEVGNIRLICNGKCLDTQTAYEGFTFILDKPFLSTDNVELQYSGTKLYYPSNVTVVVDSDSEGYIGSYNYDSSSDSNNSSNINKDSKNDKYSSLNKNTNMEDTGNPLAILLICLASLGLGSLKHKF